MLDDNERDKLESAGFTITNRDPEGAAASVEYAGTEARLLEALPHGWRAVGVKGTIDEPTSAMLERVAE